MCFEGRRNAWRWPLRIPLTHRLSAGIERHELFAHVPPKFPVTFPLSLVEELVRRRFLRETLVYRRTCYLALKGEECLRTGYLESFTPDLAGISLQPFFTRSNTWAW